MSGSKTKPSLDRYERRFELLVDAVVDYAIYMLDPQGIVTSWNSGAQRIKGYTSDEIIGCHFSQFFGSDDREAGRPASVLERARQTGRYEEEAWRIRKDGTPFWAMVVVDAIYDEDGDLIGFAKVTRDMTERREAQLALEKAKEQLFQAQKMEAVGQLTGGVAHDFNNLLTAVTGSLDLIARITQEPRILTLVETAQRAAGRGAKLTEQLLAFSRKQTLRPEAANANDLIRAFETLLRHACGENIRFYLNLADDLWLTDVDSVQFQSALLNLVINARDAITDTGVISVRTGNRVLSNRDAAEVGEIGAGDYVVVRIEDNGVGMPPNILLRAIEPFFTTKEVGKGSGLGLSQVYGFVRQLNGQLAIESEVGKGTVVSLFLPKSGSAAMQSEEDAAGETAGSSGNVLVVEDDEDVLQITVEALQVLGYRVYSARNAAEALRVLGGNQSVDIMFSDVVMPGGMNGVMLAREAQSLRPNLRILLASGYTREALLSRAGVKGDMAFIGKPYRLPDLAKALDDLRLP